MIKSMISKIGPIIREFVLQHLYHIEDQTTFILLLEPQAQQILQKSCLPLEVLLIFPAVNDLK